MIVVEQLSKTYPSASTPALDQVSLSIPDGAIYGILGRSGAGKSTLLRCLNLLERPDSGRILLDGEDLTTLSDSELRRQRQRIGMIFQGFNLLHSRNVFDNVAVPLEIAKIAKPQRHERVRELLDLVGLGDKAEAFPSQLSGGQKQRVASPGHWRHGRRICCRTKPPAPSTQKPRRRFWSCCATSIGSLV